MTGAAERMENWDSGLSGGAADVRKSVEAILSDRRARCMRAIGNQAFCDCLNGDLPLAVDFQRYTLSDSVRARTSNWPQTTRE